MRDPNSIKWRKTKRNFDGTKRAKIKKYDYEYVNFAVVAGTSVKGLFCPPIKEDHITNSTLSPKGKRVKFSGNPSEHWHDFYYSKFNPTFWVCVEGGQNTPFVSWKVSCYTKRSFSNKRHLTRLTLSSQLEKNKPLNVALCRAAEQVQCSAFMPSSGRLRSLPETRGAQAAIPVWGNW